MSSFFYKFISTLVLFSFSFFVFAQETIYVKDQIIYSACGEPIVLRGVNEMFIWSEDHTGSMALAEIAKTGANAVRLVWTTDGDVKELDKLISNCLSHDMIPIPELHDATGDFAKFQKCLDYWKRPDVLAVIQKHKRWIIVNIANEVGKGDTQEAWRNHYLDAITQLRTAGIDVPLMIDCGDYGSEERYMIENGTALMNHDPIHNLVFSVHTYWIKPDSHQGRKDRLDAVIDAMRKLNLPFVIGEGPQKAVSPWSVYCDVDFPYVYLIDRCQEEGIGWLAWSWGQVNNNDCGSPNSAFDMTDDGKFGHWASDYASTICTDGMSSIKKTSVRPFSLLKGKCSAACSKPDLGSDKSLCLVDKVVLEAKTNSSKNKTYQWFKNNQLLEGSTDKITVTEAGTYKGLVDSSGECITQNKVVVSDKLEVYLGEDVTLCEETEVTLTTGANNTAFQVEWSKDNQVFSKENKILVKEAGVYAATIKAGSCGIKSDEVVVKSMLPSISDVEVCKGKEVSLTPSGSGKYYWYSDKQKKTLIATQTLKTQATESTTYYVVDESGFETQFGKVRPGKGVQLSGAEVLLTDNMKFQVFESLVLSTVEVYVSGPGTVRLTVFDAQLKEVKQASLNAYFAGKEKVKLDVKLTPGIYYMSVEGSEPQFQYDPVDENSPHLLTVNDKQVIVIEKSVKGYLFFYNWNIKTESGSICNPKPVRVEVKPCR